MQVSNVRLTTAPGHRPGALEGNSRIRQPQPRWARSATVEGGFASYRALTIDRRMISSPKPLTPPGRARGHALADHARLLQRVCLHPVGHRPADRRPGIFLDEMRARDRDFGLVFPTSAKIPDSTDQDGAGLGVDEQFWNVGLGQPF